MRQADPESSLDICSQNSGPGSVRDFVSGYEADSDRGRHPTSSSDCPPAAPVLHTRAHRNKVSKKVSCALCFGQLKVVKVTDS